LGVSSEEDILFLHFGAACVDMDLSDDSFTGDSFTAFQQVAAHAHEGQHRVVLDESGKHRLLMAGVGGCEQFPVELSDMSSSESERSDMSSTICTRLKRNATEACIKRLCGYVSKYPMNGRSWFAKAKERYFAVVVPSERKSQQLSERAQLGRPRSKQSNSSESRWAEPEEASLCYWTDQEASMLKEPLGIVPISSIIDIKHSSTDDQGLLVNIETAGKFWYSHTLKKVVGQAGEFVLTLKFSSATEADSWASDFRAYALLFTQLASSLC